MWRTHACVLKVLVKLVSAREDGPKIFVCRSSAEIGGRDHIARGYRAALARGEAQILPANRLRKQAGFDVRYE